jgi:hypothetical protein
MPEKAIIVGAAALPRDAQSHHLEHRVAFDIAYYGQEESSTLAEAT